MDGETPLLVNIKPSGMTHDVIRTNMKKKIINNNDNNENGNVHVNFRKCAHFEYYIHLILPSQNMEGKIHCDL